MIRNKYIIIKKLVFCISLSLSLFMPSCSQDENDNSQSVTSGFSLQMKSIPSGILNNTHLYVFNNPEKHFVRKQLNISKLDDRLTTIMEEGYWNLVLLSCDKDISEHITLPAVGGNVGDYPMWTTPTDDTGNYLEQTPEIRYATLFPIRIEADQKTTESTVLNRNVAKIQVILKEYSGFDEITGNHHPLAYAELLDVPTTIMWDGKLSTSPANISSKPIREYLEFDNDGIADTLNFVVPAHKGNTASDTITHKLRLKMSMPIEGNSFHGKTPVDLSFAPRPNSIIRLFVTFRGEPNTSLDIKVSVKDWEDYITQTEEFGK